MVLLAGYAMVAPFRLTVYFYQQPAIDLVLIALLCMASAWATYRWLRQWNGLKYFALIIPVMAATWLLVEYELYSLSSLFNFISYGAVMLFAMALVAGYQQLQKPVKLPAFFMLFYIVGAVWGWYDVFFPIAQALALAGFLLLLYGFSRVKLLLKLGVTFAIPVLIYFLSPLFDYPVFFEQQKKYYDKVVYSKTTRFQQLDVTEWKGNYWFYQNGINQFSTIDSWLFFEPFAHPVMQLNPEAERVLVIGGENGMLVDELRAYGQLKLDILPIDVEYLLLSDGLTEYSGRRTTFYRNRGIKQLKGDAFRRLNERIGEYDLIFLDLPDPVDLELNQYYTREFYERCYEALKPEGLLVTQSGSPYFATAAFESTQVTLDAAGFGTLAYHNQVLSLGEWSWVIGAKSMTQKEMKQRLFGATFDGVSTSWINQEAMQMMLSFGKPYLVSNKVDVNSIKRPVIHTYFNRGNYRLR